MMKDSHFWKEVITILRNRLVFDKTTWAFSAIHGDLPTLRELFHHLHGQPDYMGSFFNSELLSIDRRSLSRRASDFYPLVNARAHKGAALTLRQSLPNREQRQVYLQLLFSLLEKPKLDD